MKSQLIPLLFISLILPCIVSLAFKHENQTESADDKCQKGNDRFLPVPDGSHLSTADQLINYEGLSTKQINYSIL